MRPRAKRLTTLVLAALGLCVAIAVLSLIVFTDADSSTVGADADCSLACVDQNSNGVIDKAEVIAVIVAYLFGDPLPTPDPASAPTPAPDVHAVSNLHAVSHLHSSPDPNASVHAHASSYPSSRRWHHPLKGLAIRPQVPSGCL